MGDATPFLRGETLASALDQRGMLKSSATNPTRGTCGASSPCRCSQSGRPCADDFVQTQELSAESPLKEGLCVEGKERERLMQGEGAESTRCHTGFAQRCPAGGGHSSCKRSPLPGEANWRTFKKKTHSHPFAACSVLASDGTIHDS